jgi:homoserine kinase type II
MGVKTSISLQEAQTLFPHFSLKNLKETSDGVMDTTYLLDNYILKHYERNLSTKILTDAKIIDLLYTNGLNTPQLLASNKEWHLYSRLQGSLPKSISYFHIQALARFMAKMHTLTYKKSVKGRFLEEYNLSNILEYCKKEHYFYYKKLQILKHFKLQYDGFIHGDIFKDNTLFHGEQIAVFDFIDGGLGEFSFDIAVALLSFNANKRSSYTKLFLNTYNQNAPYKVSVRKVEKQIKNAAKLYALLRLDKYKNPKKAKELANFW